MHPQEYNHFVWKDVKKLNCVLTALGTYLSANLNKGHWNVLKLAKETVRFPYVSNSLCLPRELNHSQEPPFSKNSRRYLLITLTHF